ncbi:Zinc finger FYVE domain-containing protein 26 [Mizuhopecten yessoensis]|uniref:Zinc finger FYVE domain-containing protein 26 n=1 Tax=Mizuhopecten yessoensis TaxID=6573 RepID=A0A210R3B2_MIZYE|nr:Zinc finger FYVE domain-containing protein 26 [Mizuhopecten yessoensis]
MEQATNKEDFPYKEERRYSVERLFRYFCNNLYLGQWEVARACLQQLHREGQLIGRNIKDFLRDITENPYERSLCIGPECSVTSPQQLSWLSLQEYRRLNTPCSEDDEKRTFEILQQNTEFHLLLLEACHNVSECVIRDLYNYHKCITEAPLTSGNKPASVTLSSDLQEFLQTKLLEHPILGHALIHAILAEKKYTFLKKNNDILQNIYLQAINNILDRYSNFCTREETAASREAKIRTVYELLALYNPEPYQNYAPLRELFTRFLELSASDGSVLDRERLLSSMVGKTNTYLVEEFCKLEYELENKCVPSGNHRYNGLDEIVRQFFHWIKNSDVKIRLHWLFVLCLKREQHFLKTILDTAINLMKNSLFGELTELLKPEELWPLKPLLLLHGWSFCKSCSQAKVLLDTLWDDQVQFQHPALEAGCSKLSYQIDLIQWCLDRTKPLLKENEDGLTSHQKRAADMFLGLETHSVLFVLHRSTRISSLDQEEVFHLLQKSPLQGETGHKSKKKVKFVRFASKEDDPAKTDSLPDVHLERWRDMSIYSGFCVIRNVMEAIYFCAEYPDSRLVNPVRPAHQRSYGEVPAEDNFKKSKNGGHSVNKKITENFQTVYTTNVTAKLNKARHYLARLQPLAFRLEILEDLFSLLFVTHEDIQESSLVETDSDEAADYDSSRNNTLDEDSQPMSLVSEESVSPQHVEGQSVFKNQTSEMSYSDQKFFPVGSAYDEPFIDSGTKPSHKRPNTETKKENDKSCIAREAKKHITTEKNKKELKARVIHKAEIEMAQKASENGTCSAHSVDSLSGGARFGFLTNEYLVRDILAMLKDCLVDLGAARFKVLGKDPEKEKSSGNVIHCAEDSEDVIDVRLEQPLSHMVQSSIDSSVMKKRIAQLTQYVHEAQWRFQLVCHECIPQSVGQVLLEAVSVTDDKWEEDQGVGGHIMESQLNNRRHTPTGSTGSRSSPSQESEVQTDSGFEGQRRRRRSRSRHSARWKGPHRYPVGIIPLMLSSPESLLNMCICKGNYPQASQVTKLLKLEARPEVAEVSFSQSYSEAVRKLHGLNIGSHKNSVPKSSKPGRSNMKALASVAAAGVATVSISGVAEKLLSQPNLPSVPSCRTWGSLPAKVEWTFQQENGEVMILFDLLCIGCRTWEMCNNMIDSIKVQLKEKPGSSRSTVGRNEVGGKEHGEEGKRSRQKDLRDMVLQFERILQLGTGVDIMTPSPGQQEISTALYKHSIQTFLQTATLPLSPDHCKLYAHLTLDVKKCLSNVESAFILAERSPVDGSPSKKRKESASSVSSQASPKKNEQVQPERPAIHSTMKQLLQTLGRDLPLGGLCQLFNKDKCTDQRRNRDYLLHLYEHLKRLAFVVAENEATSRETIVMPTNYFKMLNEGPIYTLGRLVFSKRIPPSRLEKVARELSLNLTHIIVHSCCPSIPSKHLPVTHTGPFCRDTNKVGTKFLMNIPAGGVQKCILKQQNPEEVVREILTRIQRLMKDTASKCNAKGIFDVASALVMMKTPEYDDIITSTHKLVTLDLNLFKNQDDKVCFYGNLQTLMSIHMNLDLIMEGENEDDAEETVRRPRRGKELSDMTTAEQIAHLNMFSYSVGQLGPISLFELKFVINRNGLLSPLMWEGLLEWAIHDIDEADPWHQYLPTPEPRLIFLTTACAQSSPPLQVLIPELLKNQLETAMHKYLDHTVLVDKERKTVTIPELMMWYKRDFSSEQEQELNARNEGIINIIAGHMTGATQEALQDLISLDSIHGYSENIDMTGRKELPFQTGVTSYKADFMVTFDFTVLQDRAQKFKGHRRITSLPKNLSLSVDRSRSLSNPKSPVIPSYQLTPVTLDYIKTECPLVATLVSLVCSDDLDDIEDHMEMDYFTKSETLRGRTQSEMSLMDIRSYRYQKLTDEYPTLKRHLLNYVIPIAGAEDPEILKGRDSLLKLITSNFSEKVKACMLNLPGNWQFQTVVVSILNDLLLDRKWSEILLVLDSLPPTLVRETGSFCSLYDFSLTCLVQRVFNKTKVTLTPDVTSVTFVTKQAADTAMNYLRRFLCPVTMTRLLLYVYKKLPMDQNMELFQMCRHFVMVEHMIMVVHQKLRELSMFNRITACAKNLQFRLAMKTTGYVDMEDKKGYHTSLDKFTDWRNLLRPEVISPEEILVVLLRAGDDETAKTWCRHVQFPNEKYLDVVEHQVISLLEQKPSQPSENNKAFLVLEEVKSTSAADCLALCQKLLEKLANQTDVLFIARYIITQLEPLLLDDKKDQLKMTHMGAKVLLCLPSNIRGEYCHLVSSPTLLIEQLLMNMKIDLAGKAYETIRKDQVKVQNPSLRFTVEQFNHLVATYATKALEFVTVQVIVSGKERTHSQLSNSSIPEKHDGSTEHALLSTRKSVVFETLRASRRSVDISALQKTSTSAPSPGLPPTLAHRQSPGGSQLFVMPSEPPPKDRWVQDNATDTCMVCHMEKFSMFNRRHHCRRCGRLVCAQCSTKTTMIQGIRARTCNDCFDQTHLSHSKLAKIQREAARRGGSPTEFRRASSTNNLGDIASIKEDSVGEDTSYMEQLELQWQLKAGDDSHNSVVRDDFCFEQAPSTSLCMSILDLHSNTKASGQLVLQLCDDLSKHLKSIAPGLPNPEVDYSLVLSMMKSLLFHAKMKFSECGETQGLGQCELYQGRIDILGVLVADNYRDLPSLQELTKPDIVRRLRDKLIEAERLPLAVEVSTKCGLDPAGVWAAWGMSCLQGGDFNRAREKLGRCLKVPKDRNQSQQESTLLSDIISCLESMSGVGSTEYQMLLTNPGSVKSILACPTASYTDEADVESAQYQECLYYLRTYASFHTIVSFHRGNGYWMKATQYILDHKCSSEVFVDALLSPAIEEGRLGELVDQMVMIDPSLERWHPYLTTACRYLLKHRLHHTLYQFQLFMKDFIRAAMTCITYFYQKGAQSYLDLSGKVNYLYKAHQHLQAYLDPSQWGSISRPQFQTDNHSVNWDKRPAEASIRLIQTPEEVSRHLMMVSLQIEVTKFLHECLTNTEADATKVASSYVNMATSQQLPTLMGSSKVKGDLVIMILLSGNDIVQAFGLANKILKGYHLGAGPLLTHAAREMAKQSHYDNIRQLLDCMVKGNLGDDDTVDELVGACILVISDNPNEAKEAENLIKLLRKDTNKINAYILCGKLRSAYLMAVKSERVDDVQRIAGAAQRMGQTAVKNICNKWLQQRK